MVSTISPRPLNPHPPPCAHHTQIPTNVSEAAEPPPCGPDLVREKDGQGHQAPSEGNREWGQDSGRGTNVGGGEGSEASELSGLEEEERDLVLQSQQVLLPPSQRLFPSLFPAPPWLPISSRPPSPSSPSRSNLRRKTRQRVRSKHPAEAILPNPSIRALNSIP